MSREVVVVSFAAGAGALALWVDVRFPRLGPSELRGVVLHAVCAFGVFFVSDTIYSAIAGGDAWSKLLALFVVDLSVLTYMLIVCFWVLKLFRGALSTAR